MMCCVLVCMCTQRDRVVHSVSMSGGTQIPLFLMEQCVNMTVVVCVHMCVYALMSVLHAAAAEQLCLHWPAIALRQRRQH
jgi:hypothetical protein